MPTLAWQIICTYLVDCNLPTKMKNADTFASSHHTTKKFKSASNYPDTRIILKILCSKARIISFDNMVKGHTLQAQYNRAMHDYSFIPADIWGSHYR
jgi:hypothetical protein